MSFQNFFIEYGRVIQTSGIATVVFAAGWLARRAKPKVIAGWTYSDYPIFIKMLSLMFAVFMTAAVIYNGSGLFKQDWWVAPAILFITVASYFFMAEVFLTSLRWSDTKIELHRFPFAKRTIKLEEITSARYHGATESLTLVDKSGAKLWFPYGNRAGIAGLFALLGQRGVV